MPPSLPLKRLPDDDNSFWQIRKESLAYVDKTRFIRKLEERGYHFPLIMRPQGFGKKVFTDMLEAYYDKAQAGNFEKHFKALDISRNPTLKQGQYYVLHLDFSGIAAEHLIPQFIRKLQAGFADFFRRYPELPRPTVAITAPYPVEHLNAFLRVVSRAVRRRLYVIIDEYDSFADQRFANNPRALPETSLLNSFYERLKESTDESVTSRMFITGSTPYSLEFMTSGFSIAEDLSRIDAFADLGGFTENELLSLIDEVADFNDCPMSLQDILSQLQNACRDAGFSASSRTTPVYNSSACLNFLRSLNRPH